MNESITVFINGKATQIAVETSLDALIAAHGCADVPVAVAVNTQFVPRAQYAAQRLHADDCIDIVAPIHGG